MKLTKKKALELTIEQWEWLAKSGEDKRDWLGWGKYGYADNYCFLCSYVGRKKRSRPDGCKKCPLNWGAYGCEENDVSQFEHWRLAKTTRTKRKYAKLFLAQLKDLIK